MIFKKMFPPDQQTHVSVDQTFRWFFFSYLLVWLILLTFFIGLSKPIMKSFLVDQANKRLEANAVLLDAYFSALNIFSDQSDAQLDMLCKNLDKPPFKDAWITIFSPHSRIIADSKNSVSAQMFVSPRPEVAIAMEKGIGKEVRYSPTVGRRMAFLAYPHVRLGKVAAIIRMGIPFSSLNWPLWMMYFKIALAGAGLSLLAAIISLFVWEAAPASIRAHGS